MNKKTLWLLGGTAAGGLILWRYMSRKPPQSESLRGLGALGGEAEDWTATFNSASATFNKLTKDIEPLPEKLKSGYANVLWVGAGSIYPQIKLSYDLGMAKNYPPAMIYAKAALANLRRIAPLIAADLADSSGAKSEAIIVKRLENIAKVQEANEADRKLAEQGAVPYVLGKVGQAAGSVVGSVASGIGAGLWGFVKKIPWWVYGIGAAGTVIYFFGPAIKAKITQKFSRPKPAPAPVPVPVQANPRKRGFRRRR